MIVKRVVFGEPNPGFSQFAGIVAKLPVSVGYCNKDAGGHDRITDVPFAVPLLGLDFVHPPAFSFVSAPPPADDEWGVFAYHHVQLYEAGVLAAKLDPVTVAAVGLCRAIYAYPGDQPAAWDERLDTAGVSWGLKFEGRRAYVVFRGSDDLLDWVRDLTGLDPARIFQHDELGPMWDGFLIGMDDAWAAIRPLLSGVDEIIFTGHSLGAARADVAAAYACLESAPSAGNAES